MTFTSPLTQLGVSEPGPGEGVVGHLIPVLFECNDCGWVGGGGGEGCSLGELGGRERGWQGPQTTHTASSHPHSIPHPSFHFGRICRNWGESRWLGDMVGTGCFWGAGLTPGEMVRTRWETFGK